MNARAYHITFPKPYLFQNVMFYRPLLRFTEKVKLQNLALELYLTKFDISKNLLNCGWTPQNRWMKAQRFFSDVSEWKYNFDSISSCTVCI